MKDDKTDAQVELLLAEFRAFRDTEWRQFREDVSGWKADAGERLATLETNVKTGITGNGQPSRLQVVENEVKRLTNFKFKLIGIACAASAGISGIAAIIHYVWR